MPFEIRDFAQQDKENYLSLSRQFYSSSAVDHTVPDAHFLETFRQCIKKSPYLRGLALLVDGVFAGYALISLTWSNEAGGLCVLLEEANISPDYQGQGLGSAFFEFVETEYANVAKRFRLEVTSVNTSAIRLYKRLGYKEFDYVQMIKDL